MFNATISLRVHKLGIDELEACATVEDTLSWGQSVIVNIYQNGMLIDAIRIERESSCVGVQGKLCFYGRDAVGSWQGFVQIYTCGFLWYILRCGSCRISRWEGRFFNLEPVRGLYCWFLWGYGGHVVVCDISVCVPTMMGFAERCWNACGDYSGIPVSGFHCCRGVLRNFWCCWWFSGTWRLLVRALVPESTV